MCGQRGDDTGAEDTGSDDGNGNGSGNGNGNGGDDPSENYRPADAPAVVVLSVSGHCFASECAVLGYNREYLYSQGTLDVALHSVWSSGYEVLLLDFADEFYNWVSTSDPNHVFVYGFLDMLEEMAFIRDEWVSDFVDPTRVILVGHSHGTVWAHIAAFLMPDLPIDLLVDLDGESLGWEGLVPGIPSVGDEWADVILDYSIENGVTWPFAIWDPANSISVPGLSQWQDIEDVVPDHVQLNVEVQSEDPVISDAEDNHRLDGSTTRIITGRTSEDHSELAEPNSDAVLWVKDVVQEFYYLR